MKYSWGWLNYVILICLYHGYTFALLDNNNWKPSYNGYESLASLTMLETGFMRQFRNLSLHSLSDQLQEPPNPTCLAHLNEIINALAEGELWAIKFFDAWGKIPAGILEGNWEDLGHFDECLKLKKKVTEADVINGKYCIVTNSLGVILNNPTLYPIRLNLGTCLPDSCTAREFKLVFAQVLENVLGIPQNPSANFVLDKICATSEKVPISGVGIGAITILCIFLVLMLLGSIYDVYTKRNSVTPNQFFLSFSLMSNTRQLFKQTNYKNVPHVISCLNGIRCLSMLCVIYGHDYRLQVAVSQINLVDLIAWTEKFWAITMRNATYAVETFFFMSGMLVVMAGLREMDRNHGKLNILLMYVNRYIRLTPLLALAVMALIGIIPLLGSGPYWNSFYLSTEVCKESWWTTLLYVQNYVKTDKVCLGHAWYLAVDTQLFLFAPLALLLLHKFGKKGAGVIFIVGILFFACLFSLIIVKDVNIGLMIREFDSEASKAVYSGTHTRAVPWIAGLLFGYFMYLRKGRKPQLSFAMVATGWALTFALLGTILYSLYPYMNGSGKDLSIVGGAFYYSCSSVGWSLVLSWIIFACEFGYGGLINDLLSWSYWQPFAKLSYGIYIWHALVVFANTVRPKTHTYFSDYELILRFWGDFGLSLCIAFVTYLVVEAPLAGIQNYYLKKRKIEQSQTKGGSD